MLWLQLLDHRNRRNGFQFWDRRSLVSEAKSNDDATLELVSTTDVDDEETHSCLQQLVMEDNKTHSHRTWEDVHSQLITTLATLQRKSSTPWLSQYDYSDDDDDDDTFRVLYHCGFGGASEDERLPLRKRSHVDIAAEKQRYEFFCETIQKEFRDLFQSHDIWDVRIHQSLLVLLVSRYSVEEECAHSFHVEEAIRTIASFLINPSLRVDVKLAALQILLFPSLSRTSYDDSADTATGMYCSTDGKDSVAILYQQTLREVYAFCIALCFGVNDLEHAMSTSSSPLVSPMLWELRSTCLYLQEVHSIFYDVSNSRPLSNPVAAGKMTRREQQWEQVKSYLFETNSILLKDLDVLRSLYNILSIRHVVIVASVGYLRICSNSNPPTDASNQSKYYEALDNVAQFLVDWMVADRQKIAVLKCLQLSTGSITAKNRTFYTKVLSFCIDPNAYTDSFVLTSSAADSEMDSCAYYLLLWELRVLCGHYLPQQRLRNFLRLLWRKALPRVRVALSVMGKVKHASCATLASSAQKVLF